jgi:hypothetical protein
MRSSRLVQQPCVEHLKEMAAAQQLVPASATSAALSQMLWKPMPSIFARFGHLEGLLMLEQIDTCYLVV